MEYGLWNGQASIRLSRQSTAAVAVCSFLLLSTMWVGDIDQQRRAPSGNGAAARRWAANAGSVVLTAEGRGWKDLLM